MQKLFILVAVILATFGLKAQNNYDAFITPSGNFEFSGEIFTQGTQEELQNKVKEWFMTSYINYSKDGIIDGDINTGEFTARANFTGKRSYNPFAGSFTDNITYLFRVKVEPGKINYRIFSIKVTTTYVGWTVNNTIRDLSEEVQKMTNAQTALNILEQEKKPSKKAMKEQKNIIKEQEEMVGNIVSKLKGIINSFEREMKR